MTEFRWLVALLLACLAQSGAAQDSPQAAALLSLPSATSNWDAATAALNGSAWQAGSDPCGGGGSSAWKGVTCGGSGAAADAVTQLQLPRLGLEGTLPGQLAQLPSLALLDLSGNAYEGGIPEAWLQPAGFPSLATALLAGNRLGGAPLPSGLLSLATQRIDLGGNRFTGPLPANWTSASLIDLDLRDNQLTGGLPGSWGGSTALPQLALLHLQGNNLSGLVPEAWTAGAFASPLVLESRPGNERLCGPGVPLDPKLFPEGHPERNAPIIPAANSMRTGNNLTTVVLIQRGMFEPSTSVTITNWLGSCAVPCNEAPGWPAAPADVSAARLSWPPTVSTNIFDVSWVYNMSIFDLVNLNPGAATLRPGAALTVPCYPGGPATRFDYYGGSVAFGQFSGGNQQAGQGGNVTSDSLPGAMAAARVNGGIPNEFHWPSVYVGSAAPAVNGSSNGQVSEPVYWFVDLLAPFQVVSVMVTAGIDMRNASIYIGSNLTSVFANTLVASGLALAAGQQKALAGKGTLGRYVIIYTGTSQQGTLGLDDVQVYAMETNTAANKPVTASRLGSISSKYPFVDHFKMARPWFSASASSWEDTRPLQLDSNGHVRVLAPGQYARSVLFAGSPADPSLSGKRFAVLYSGRGTLEYGNVQVLSRQPGKDVIQLKTIASGQAQTADLIFILTLTATNATNPLRALRVLPAAGGICAGNPYKQVASAAGCSPTTKYRPYLTAHAEILFMPHFLAGLRLYRLIRFMDWQRTNDATMQSMSQRALQQHTFWSTQRSVPLEVIIRLANTLGADPWICIPHRATDQFVAGYAQIIKALLAPGLRVHTEYANEVWNGMFSQTQYALDRGKALQLDPDAYTALCKFYSRRAQQVFTIFQRELNGTQRLRRVMATQAVVPYFTQQILSYTNARRVTDLFAIAPYFGTTLTTAAKAAEVKRLGTAGLLAWLKSPAGAGGKPSNSLLGYGSLADVDAAVAAQVAAVRQFGVNLTSYEGGQHLVAVGGLTWDSSLNAILDAANRHAAMKQVYLQYLSTWRARTGQLLTHYVHCDRWSVWGRWGAREYPTQPRTQAPKLDALLQYAAAAPLDL